MTNQETLKKCICFCTLCEKEWRGNERKVWEIQKAISVCAVCESFLCGDENHSLYDHDSATYHCKDSNTCHAVIRERDEGGGD